MTAAIIDARRACDSADVGGKARTLARAARSGMSVPAFCVVSDHACVAGGAAEMHPDVRRAIAAAIVRLSPDGQPLAVRSSAGDEDGSQHSFAGQFASFLNVAPEDAPERVFDVWQSAFSDQVAAYRRQHALAGARLPAVIVQRMLTPSASGVAFSADPVSGRRGIAVVAAVRGLGDALVAGTTDADTWRVDCDGQIVDRQLMTSHGAEGPVLSDDQVRDVAALARQASRLFCAPQDIEWAIDGGLYLLQSRPVTSLRTTADPDAVPAIWDNSNIVESYNGVTLPLTFSFVREIYPPVYRQFCRMMGVPASVIGQRDETFENVLGLVRGRLYYNLLNWYRILALLPGYRLNRRFMEQMMGVTEPLPEEDVERIAGGIRGSRLIDALRLVRTLAGLAANHVTLDRRVKAFYRRVDDALAPPGLPLADCRPHELVEQYRNLRRRLLLAWDAPLVNDFFAMVFYGLLRRQCSAWCGDAAGALQNDLIAGDDGMISAEPARLMRRLARMVSSDPKLVSAFKSGSAHDIREQLRGHPRVADTCDEYLARFGDRTINELKLESLTLHDDPTPLFRAIGDLASRLRPLDTDAAALAAKATLRQESRDEIARALAGHPFKRAVLLWTRKHARRRIRDRENLRLERTRLFARVRQIFLELGKRLYADDVLAAARDVFYLEVEELLAYVDGRSTCTNLRALVALRKDEFGAFEQQPAPPSRFQSRGIVYSKVLDEYRPQGTAAGSAIGPGRGRLHQLEGTGCSAGIVRGIVTIVRDPRTTDIAPGSILVAEHTDPGWILIFPKARGVIVERGSQLSHAAIVARELGIPAIVSLKAATTRLRDGDEVEMDGATGVVRLLAVASTDVDTSGFAVAHADAATVLAHA